MEITWLGRNCFRLKGKEGTVITDPCPPDSGYKLGKPAAEVVTVSCPGDGGYNYVDGVTGEPFVLDVPGEFEIGGILVTGIASKRTDGSRNVIFVCELDGIRVGHMGLPGAVPGAGILEDLKDIDILLMPVGAGNSIGGAAASDVMTTIDPRIAIPMNYKTDVERMELEPLDKFMKETGLKAEPQPKLTVTKSGLPQNLAVMLLQPRS